MKPLGATIRWTLTLPRTGETLNDNEDRCTMSANSAMFEALVFRADTFSETLSPLAVGY